MRLDRPLSILEHTALGIVLKRGPCLAHTVLGEFAGSRTSEYRSGAGSIYPLLRRLTEGELLVLEGRHYQLSPAGREALRDWLKGPFEESQFNCGLDEFRSRAYFLRLLSREEAIAYAEAAVLGLRNLRSRCEETLEEYRRSGDRFSELAMRGAVKETEARIEWMSELLGQFRSDEFWATTRSVAP